MCSTVQNVFVRERVCRFRQYALMHWHCSISGSNSMSSSIGGGCVVGNLASIALAFGWGNAVSSSSC